MARPSVDPRIALWTLVAMVAFAANSVLCRMALGARRIDPASFTAVRLATGAIALSLIAWAGRAARPVGRSRGEAPRGGARGTVWRRWASPVALFLYAACFSFAYLTLSAGAGALILFGAVQVTMIVAGLVGGERPRALEWLGLSVALGGLVLLTSPGLSTPASTAAQSISHGVAAPHFSGAVLMAVAGIAWGLYSLAGRGGTDPVRATTRNFLLAVPLALAVVAVAHSRIEVTRQGLVLATLSGALASGIGYVIWYAALRGLSATRAATVQLSVPVLAALGGVALLSETISFRLALATVLVLGGVGLSILGRAPRKP
jgi:drug/metabolite transporter (DMT)-like permease